MRYSYRTSHGEAYQVSCPECHVAAGAPCVYLPYPLPATEHSSQSVRNRVALTGTPTQRPHNGRFNAAFQRSVRTQRVKYRGSSRVPISPATPEQRAIARAQRDFDRREWLLLARWLRRWGHILNQPPAIVTRGDDK